MPRSMGHQNYVYTPISPEARQRRSVAARVRLGIPAGHVQVYGVHVPEERTDPLRSYAVEVARRWGAEKARAFVLTAAANDWEVEKPPFPIRLRKFGPPLPPREFVRIQKRRRATRTVARFARHWGLAEEREQRLLLRVCRTVARFARHWERRQSVDWLLVEELLTETANIEEVARFLNLSETHVKKTLRRRHDQGLSVFGRRVRRR